MEALLQQRPASWREVANLLMSALDAHLHPQGAGPSRWRLPFAVLLPTLVAVVLSPALALSLRPLYWDRPEFLWRVDGALIPLSPILQGLALAGFWSIAALGSRLAGFRVAVWIWGLVAFRYALQGLVLYVVQNDLGETLAATFWRRGWIPVEDAMGLALIGLWTAVAVIVLRRARVPWPLAAAAGCALELLVGSVYMSAAGALDGSAWYVQAAYGVAPHGDGVPHGGLMPQWLLPFSDGWPLRIAVWAAVLGALANARERGLNRGSELPERGTVPPRPMSDFPPR
jgi:hypothetical protein